MPEFLDQYHAHEALDRTSLLVDQLHTQLLEHPYIKNHAYIQSKIRASADLLAEAYQLIAALYVGR